MMKKMKKMLLFTISTEMLPGGDTIAENDVTAENGGYMDYPKCPHCKYQD
jgi:hypothetical protein